MKALAEGVVEEAPGDSPGHLEGTGAHSPLCGTPAAQKSSLLPLQLTSGVTMHNPGSRAHPQGHCSSKGKRPGSGFPAGEERDPQARSHRVRDTAAIFQCEGLVFPPRLSKSCIWLLTV